MLDALVDKYVDWFEHTDDYTERNVIEEVLTDLRELGEACGHCFDQGER